jgi:hypothetical protein
MLRLMTHTGSGNAEGQPGTVSANRRIARRLLMQLLGVWLPIWNRLCECRRGQAGCFALEQVHIANKAVYLASDETERTTGQIFPVDRGATIR